MKRCPRNGGFVNNEDRISQLPEALHLHILSLLPTKDVVATSALSKQWRSLWKMVPKLEFDYDSNQNDIDATEIGMWIGIAYARQVRELVLHVYSDKGSSFKFPPSLYNCETLETLTLKTWVLVDVPSQACLKSLKTLHLYVDFEDDASVRNLLSGCPKLENLVMDRGTQLNVETYNIAVPSLQRLTIYDDSDGQEFGGYVINVPSLKYLEIKGFHAHDYCLIENAPELVEAKIMNVSDIVNENILGSITSAKRLCLELSPLKITFPMGSIFYQLEYLELYTHKAEWWNLLLLMLNASPRLQVLKLIGRWYCDKDRVACGNWNDRKNVSECMLLHLKTFVWHGVRTLSRYIRKRKKPVRESLEREEDVDGLGSAADLDQ